MGSRSIEDMSVLARRGSLSETEERRLSMALRASVDLEMWHSLGCDFDAVHVTVDKRVLDRVQRRTRVQFVKPRARRGHGRAARSFALVGVLLSGTAAAIWGDWWGEWGATDDDGSDAVVAAPVHFAVPGAAQRQPKLRGLGKPASESPRLKQATEQEHHADSTPLIGSPGVGPEQIDRGRVESASARVAFQAANLARKQGNITRSLELYETLQRKYPSSSEANLSHVLSGRLLLRLGQPDRALQHFNRYLQRGAPGGLAEEALYGKAEVFRQMGRVEEEKQVWRDLLERFPNSMHRQVARGRISE